jgi:hypothetical protein
MAHWREPANLMWWNVEHVTGTHYFEHAKTKRYTQRRGAWGDARRGAAAGRRGRCGREQVLRLAACGLRLAARLEALAPTGGNGGRLHVPGGP